MRLLEVSQVRNADHISNDKAGEKPALAGKDQGFLSNELIGAGWSRPPGEAEGVVDGKQVNIPVLECCGEGGMRRLC